MSSTTAASDLVWGGVDSCTDDAKVVFPMFVSRIFPSSVVSPSADPGLAGWSASLVINVELEGPSLSFTSGTIGGRALSVGAIPSPAFNPCPLLSLSLSPIPHAYSLMTRKLRQYLRWTWMVSAIEARAPDSGGRDRVSTGGGSPRRVRVQAAMDSEMDVRL